MRSKMATGERRVGGVASKEEGQLEADQAFIPERLPDPENLPRALPRTWAKLKSGAFGTAVIDGTAASSLCVSPNNKKTQPTVVVHWDKVDGGEGGIRILNGQVQKSS